jgi:hypothetical protein
MWQALFHFVESQTSHYCKFSSTFFYNSEVLYRFKEQNVLFLSFFFPLHNSGASFFLRMCHLILCHWSNGFLTDSKPIQGRVNVVYKTTCYSGTNWKATHIFASGIIRGLLSALCSSSSLSVERRYLCFRSVTLHFCCLWCMYMSLLISLVLFNLLATLSVVLLFIQSLLPIFFLYTFVHYIPFFHSFSHSKF